MNSISLVLNSLRVKFVSTTRRLAGGAVLVLATGMLFGQCDPPALDVTLTFEQPADYRKADRSAMAAIDWLLEEPLNRCEDDRNRLNAYVLVWLSGHPDVKVELQTAVFPFLNDFPELLFPVLFAMGRYVMLNQGREDSILQQHVAGMEAVLSIADNDKKYRTDAQVKALRKLRRKDQLTSYVSGLLTP